MAAVPMFMAVIPRLFGSAFRHRLDIEVRSDRLFKLPCRAKRATLNVLLGERGEPAFDLIEPRRGSRSEVNMEARMTSESVFDRRRLVRTVAVLRSSAWI